MLLFTLLDITTGIGGQLLMSAFVSILGIIILYIFAVPVIQSKIEYIITESKQSESKISELTNKINKISTDVTVVEKSITHSDKMIEELFTNQEKNSEKFSQMIQKNTEAINKLESTLQSLSSHTQQLESFFKTVISSLKK